MECIKLVMVTSAIIFSARAGYSQGNASNREMIKLLSITEKKQYAIDNPFSPEARIAHYDSVLRVSTDTSKLPFAAFYRGQALLEWGNELQSIAAYEKLLEETDTLNTRRRSVLMQCLGMAYLRLGERTNCLHNHTAQSCLFPIQQGGVHKDLTGSSKAITFYEKVLRADPDNLEARWLLNIAYMTIGGYPHNVPSALLIQRLGFDSLQLVKPFSDEAMTTGLNTNDQAGGSIIDDFNNDTFLDIVTSSWSLREGMLYKKNNGNGTFTDVSAVSGLADFTGGLNIMQTDYNNDGLKDIFVLRGAWKGIYGKEPNSLLRNNGDGTFTDVTKESGLLSFHPTQTATWNDFNNDGWLDVFIGNEATGPADPNPCELYINNKNGSFTEMAMAANAGVNEFVKGVTSGDYNNDGWPDIFISILGVKKILLQNQGLVNGSVQFKDVTREAGLGNFHTATFPTCFLDYDNDGWLDILVCGYEFKASLAVYAAGEALDMNIGNAGYQFLFRNKQDGTFENVTNKVGLNRVAFAMGMNFGDIDNDGYPDIYLGTGNPQYQSLVPNKMFKNLGGVAFADVTSQARVGNLQKGHGVSFADMDNDGDEDIHIDMGGAFPGDVYQSSFYINPGQNNNRWISLELEGTKSNRAAIGARIRVSFKENGIARSVYRDVNSGGSFGSNPLMQHIGIGAAALIDRVEIKWQGSGIMQVFENIQPGQRLKIKEGDDSFTVISQEQVDFTKVKSPDSHSSGHGH